MPPRQRCEACVPRRRHVTESAPDAADAQQDRLSNAFSAGLSRRAARRTRNSPASTVLLDVSQLLPVEMQARQPGAANSPGAALLRLQPVDRSIVAPPSSPLHDRVLNRFLSRWAAGSTCLGCQDFVVETYEASASDSAMRSAIEATAYADLVVADRHGDFASKSFRAYLTTLGRIQRQLRYLETSSDVWAGVRQAVLAAILVLDSYEVSTFTRGKDVGCNS
ncbi:hypothetical protein LTR91_017058 [Friedmanniomyces endolithicus]|uniref:Uncharacterized protein n=1 Tax=Friedmanniomyces endolithicus TaxID=329885 RepID=A0AAN6QJV8_9PEZI|nr:hypothetical protein LTR57_019912 [Friedmanniomyces endolithicus]KAK0965039.1 hypothetical protein LTS01_018516 [Friedmanniomyces endolithicus]KAK0967582.1 hypothetical protein LTR91_017058 [Friedmanniomyces endolithicus]KAK1029634.1 hypothetical protein LTS16_019583 [Friedmanniomyces endolithicus]